jgi:hypothetical protein
LFGGLSPAFAEAASRRQAAKQKMTSRRPLRLCGENSNLQMTGFIYFGSMGNLASTHSSQPPLRAKTFEYPREINCRAVQALVSSLGQLQ